MNDQWACHLAPWATQLRRVSISPSVNFKPEYDGGFRELSSVAVMRRTNSLASGFPGTMARLLSPKLIVAAASLSKRSGTPLAVASVPWHRKHLSARIGL